MNSLTAEFDLHLPDALIVKCAEGYSPTFAASIDGFDVEVSLSKDLTSAQKRENERHFTYAYSSIKVRVTREEHECPPVTPLNKAGGRDLSVRAKYFRSRKGDYHRVAHTAVNRLLSFFRYRLRQPVPSEVSFGNAIWTDEGGNTIDSGYVEFTSGFALGLDGSFAVQPFTRTLEGNVAAALLSDRRVYLWEQLLADAQSAAFEGNIRRAVVELAITCEVAAKQKLFGDASRNRQAVDYLEDKGKVRNKVLELIDGVAKRALGESFRERFPADFQHVDYLFRCRNKIVHRGTATYKDDAGIHNTLDRPTLKLWWRSAVRMLVWLRRA